MDYAGEHPIPGQIGNLLVALSLAAALTSTVSYFLATRFPHENGWLKMARAAFKFSTVAAFGFISVMFYLLINQYYEYNYVWEHNNSSMSFKYILVCFWGGQEGSFMLWIFWHSVLGLLLSRKKTEWEPYVMAIFAMVQAFLVSMLLGIYIGDYRLGSSPFALQRESADPAFATLWSLIPDYLKIDPRFADGRGLNPLLQNYWMIIHPPTLFLGFALTVVPFAYAIAALWRKQLNQWFSAALPWTFAGILVLGTGILMGGAWAYESLSFGGFWAWDPVENASLVPWLTLVGAGHLILSNKHRPKSVYSALFFSLITFILIMYSTFLTRSGILGETSVHSFTGEGMLGQLLAYLLFFIWLSFVMLLYNKKSKIRYTLFAILLVIIGFSIDLNTVLFKSGETVLTLRSVLVLVAITFSIIFLINNYLLHFPREKQEENLWSREFWMFIGALVLLMSSMQIIYNTSLPVINAVFDTKMHLLETAVRNQFYNSIQTGFAIIIAVLIAMTQFLKYKDTSFAEFGKKLLVPLLISVVLTVVLGITFVLTDPKYVVLLFATLFSITANIDYWLLILKGKVKNAGASIAHIGFGLVLLGALISQNKQEIISETIDGDNLRMLGETISNTTDAQLFRNDTILMKNYFASYRNRHQHDHFLYYDIDYFETIPAQYQPGDLIVFEGNVYRCTQAHTAGTSLQADKDKWEFLADADQQKYFSAKTWINVEPGKKIFDLQPFIQLNDMNNVAEPGTKHFLSYDVFTHLVYADPRLREETDTLMRPFTMNGNVGDTLITPGFLAIINNIQGIDDSLFSQYHLQEGDLAAKINLTIYDIWDVLYHYGLKKELVFYLRNGEFKADAVYIPELKTSLRVNKITPKSPAVNDIDSTQQKQPPFMQNETDILIDVVTPEFVVLHAIKFPWINLLWLGCIIMAVGTFMAVRERFKKA